MARTRNIKPAFFRNPDLLDCSPLARLLFIGLWTMADRDGRVEDHPRKIRLEIMPSDDADIDTLLWELSDHKFVIRYVSGGEGYIQVVNFAKHQNPHPKEESKGYPPPEDGCFLPSRENTRQAAASNLPALPYPLSLIPHPSSLNLTTEVTDKPCSISTEPEPTKAKRNAKPSQTLHQCLETSGGIPPLEWGEWAYTTFGWDADRISFEWDDFSDYWQSGNAAGGGRKSDWPATWRSHCRRNAANSNRGYRTGGKARSGFAAAFASSVAGRYGISPNGSGVSGRAPSQGTGEDAGANRNGIPVGEIPF